MSLPKWIDYTGVSVKDHDRLIEAIIIAWEALEFCALNPDDHKKATEAMRRIEELGKESK